MSDVKYSDLEKAYTDSVVGSRIPDLIIVSGVWVLKYRPDLEGKIDPNKSYYVTAKAISEVEGESR